ncbi:MAG TPA: 16S rRNA (cytidine(1402)-2'-O)-methyltransferase [Acidimicrobiia bacterium]|nr:16S rRNA (cytidine(1402)-2'-O)-methyltransferase [Acidimicrobiia bacterium]
MAGRLYLCSTPIGNLGDASPRLGETLGLADVVYAEDTRRSAKLLAALGVSADLRSYFVGNERARTVDLEADLADGRDVAIITDAGSPAVSDPGASAVAAARRAGAQVVVIPGPSAVTAVVSGSGMVEGRFVFEGFLARRGKERAGQLEAVATDLRPTVIFLSPHRALADLTDLAAACGTDREVCVGRELTKLYEELWWGTLGQAVDRWSEEPPRGEFSLVVAGAEPAEPDPEAAADIARRLVDDGMSPSQAAREAATATGVARRTIYERLVN